MAKPRKVPQRTCVGCGTVRAKRELTRVVRTPEGVVLLDPTGKKSGRGAYVCPDPACVRKALKSGALGRALQTDLPDEVAESLEAMIGKVGDQGAAARGAAIGGQASRAGGPLRGGDA